MRNHGIKTLLRAILICVVIFMLACSPAAALDDVPQGAEVPKTRVVRVAYPIQMGLTEKDAKGNYSGYTYEYLQEIAQYTGWDYEFVEIEGNINDVLTQMLEMLQTGEIDLMGGLLYTDALSKKYDYPNDNYGTSYSLLCVLEQNPDINETTFLTLKKLRVAVLESAKTRNSELVQYCERNGVIPELIYTENQEEMIALLKEGKVDAISWNDSIPLDGVRTVARFSPRPFYFATTKGNTELLRELNSAMLTLSSANPNLTTELYEKYFVYKSAELFLSEAERDYIENKKEIRVAVGPYGTPIQSYNEETGEFKGIGPDILRYISEKTGLNVTFVKTDTQQQLEELLLSGQIDAVAGVEYNYNLAKGLNVALTKTYASSQLIMVLNKNVSPNDLHEKTIALPYGFSHYNVSDSKVIWFDTVQECMDAVNAGKADYSYGHGYAVQYCANRSIFRNISLIPQDNMQQGICVGVVKPTDTNLLNIINKAIHVIPESELQTIIYRNTVTATANVTLWGFVESNPWLAILVIGAFAALVIVFLLWHLHTRAKNSVKIALDNERYLQLSELSNEFLFEYSFREDKLIQSGKRSGYFGDDRVVEHFQETLQKMIKDGEPTFLNEIEKSGSATQKLQMSDGSYRWVRVISKLIRDADNRPLYAIGKVTDIQQEQQEKESLMKKAEQDGLTGVYHAAAVRQKVEQSLIQQKKGEVGAFFMIDIDHFKEINDRFGHYTGDMVLIGLAQAAKSAFRSEDIIGRLGGDEFIIFAKNMQNREIIAEKCDKLSLIVKSSTAAEQGLPVTLSIGVAMTRENDGYDDLYQRADKALYTVKNGGRDGYDIL